MEGKQAIGLALLLLGLLLFVAATLGRTGATFAALVYGDSVLRSSPNGGGGKPGGSWKLQPVPYPPFILPFPKQGG